MENGKFQIGVIGTGMVAQWHLQNFTKDRRTQVRWVAEVSRDRLDAAVKEFKVPHGTVDYREMLDDPGVDAVVVCTPVWTHVKIGVDAMRAGKHLLMEKPLATTTADARKLLAEARKHPRVMVSGCSCRHSRLTPKYPVIRKMIEGGELGEIYLIHHRGINRQQRGGIEYNPKAKWFLDQKLSGGGPIYDWGVYDLSFHLGVLNEPKFLGVTALCRNGLDKVESGAPFFTVEEHGVAFMQFEGGLHYYYERATNAHTAPVHQTCIYGTRGGLRFGFCTWDPSEIEYFYVDRHGRGKAKTKVIRVSAKGHKGDMAELGQAFIAYLSDEGPCPMPLELEVKNLEILHAIYRAADWPKKA